MTPPRPPVADGTILVHVGFHKTGTTALQSAFARDREALLASGLLYPGTQRSHHRAAMAVTERTWGWQSRGGRKPRAEYWDGVVAQARAHQGRVMISSEALALANEEAIDRIIGDLGAERLQVVGTLRPFARLLASSWQQYLKYGLAMPYAQWLENVFANPPECPPSPNFWVRNDFVGVFSRWAERLGPERVTLVVLDEADRGFLFRTFEGLLDLPAGELVPDPQLGASNRSMTAAEAEMLRLVNERGARQWDWPLYQHGVRRGAVMRMVESRTPALGEPSLATPEWAVRAAQDVGGATAEGVAALGITVIGDPNRLSDPIPAADPPTEGLLLPVDAAAEAVLGGVLGALVSVPAREVPPAAPLKPAADVKRGARDSPQPLMLRIRHAGSRRLARVRGSRSLWQSPKG